MPDVTLFLILYLFSIGVLSIIIISGVIYWILVGVLNWVLTKLGNGECECKK